MIVFLLEEESMAATIDHLFPQIRPGSVLGVDWLTLHFHGKQDLERNIQRKMTTWGYGTPHFLILRDQDGVCR